MGCGILHIGKRGIVVRLMGVELKVDLSCNVKGIGVLVAHVCLRGFENFLLATLLIQWSCVHDEEVLVTWAGYSWGIGGLQRWCSVCSGSVYGHWAIKANRVRKNIDTKQRPWIWMFGG